MEQDTTFAKSAEARKTEAGVQDQAVATSDKLQPARRILFLLALLYAWVLVRLFLWGGWGIGFFLFVVLSQAFLFYWKHLDQPQTPAKPFPVSRRVLLTLLTAAILFLGACYALWANPFMRLINFPVILVLLSMQYLVCLQEKLFGWSHPLFWLEAALSGPVRPFISLGEIRRALIKKPFDANKARPVGRQAAAILIGLVIALPVLLIVGALLMSADAVFAERLSGLFERLGSWSPGLLVRQLATTVVLAPFVFSFMYSGRRQALISLQTQSFSMAQLSAGARQMIVTILITLLICLDFLYVLFVLTQLQYLAGALVSALPGHLTYAEYARSGFFELLAVSLFNVLLLFVAIRTGNSKNRAGRLLQALILLTLACSLVQWISAMARMRLYISAYSLTRLRFFSTAFMWLILVWFALLILSVFINRLPLFKAILVTALVALIALNLVVPDRWIAQHNVQRYLNNNVQQAGEIDIAYLTELSDDALPALLLLQESHDQTSIILFLEHVSKRQLAWQEQGWEDWSLSQWNASRRLKRCSSD